MSADKLRDHNLFELKSTQLMQQLTPNVVTSKTESLMRVAEDDDTPENSPVSDKNVKHAGSQRRTKHTPPPLYKMSWPVIPNTHEMEKFEKENADLRRRILIARGKLTEQEAAMMNPPDAYPLGETPKQPRSGGTIAPDFYGVERHESAVRLPASHYSFWQKHDDKAPTSVEMGLGVMSFVLPESPGDEELAIFLKKQGEINESLREEEKSKESFDEFETPKKEEEEKKMMMSQSMRSLLSSLDGKRQHEFEGTPVVPPPMKPELTVELNHTLKKKLDSTIGKGIYHDLTASALSAPMDAASALPQLQPFGFSPDKHRLRVLSMTDALKFQGDISPRTKLHHFQMHPYSSEAHEATFVIQRFWERHIRKRLR